MTRFSDDGGIGYGLASRSCGRCAACRGTWQVTVGGDPRHGAHKLSLHEPPGDNELSRLPGELGSRAGDMTRDRAVIEADPS
jgi:hypothetical protein